MEAALCGRAIGRVLLEINVKSNEAHLRISSRLLALARIASDAEEKPRP
jgi:hypothetical protein